MIHDFMKGCVKTSYEFEKLDKMIKEMAFIPLRPKRKTKAERKAAIKTLQHLGYTYKGGELWKPPICESLTLTCWTRSKRRLTRGCFV